MGSIIQHHICNARACATCVFILFYQALGEGVAYIEQNIKDGTLEEIEVPIALPDSELSLSYPLTRRNDILRKAVDIMIHSVKGSSGSI